MTGVDASTPGWPMSVNEVDVYDARRYSRVVPLKLSVGCASYEAPTPTVSGKLTVTTAFGIQVLADTLPTKVSLVDSAVVSHVNVGQTVSSGAYGWKYWSSPHVLEHVPSCSAS